MGEDRSPSVPIRSFPRGEDPSFRQYHAYAFRRGWGPSVFIGLLISLLTVGLWQLDLPKEFELRTLDARFRWRGRRPAESPVAIVFIGDDSIKEFGRWPWSWDHHALLVDILQRSGARMILFDVFFSESPGEAEAAFLGAVTERAGNVYLCSFFRLSEKRGGDGGAPAGWGTLTEPVPELLAVAAGTGHCNARPDIDGITRRIPLALPHLGDLYPSALLRVAADYLGLSVGGAELTGGGVLRLSDATGRRTLDIPVDEGGETTVNFLGGLDAFPTYSFLQVLQADRYPAKAVVDLGDLRDKIVLVGVTFAGNTDLRPTPFSSAYPMIGIQATLLDNLLTGRFVRRPPPSLGVALWLLLGVLSGLTAFALRPLVSLPLVVLLGGSYLGASVTLFNQWRLHLELAGPLTALFLSYLTVTTLQYVEARRQKMRYLERMKYLGHLVESSTDAIVSFDPSGSVMSWNQGAREIYGYAEKEALERNWAFLAPPEQRAGFETCLRRTMAGEAVESREMVLSRADGSTLTVEASFSPIRNSRGDLVGTSLISQDLSEKKKMTEMLIQSEKLAEIGRMGSGIVHEIKNPLTSIMMMSSMLTSDGSLPGKVRKYADIIEKESQRILRLSRNILSFARPTKAEMKAVDLNAVLSETLELAEYELKKSKVAIRRDLAAGLPPAWGDGEKLKQVFLNVITNAGHAMEQGGELLVVTASSPDGEGSGVEAPEGWRCRAVGEVEATRLVVVRIRDTGPGIPEEVLERLFEPFFSTKGEGKGTGLGLYVSRNIVLEHRGRIAVASAVGEGTVFTVVLPQATS